MGIDIAAERKRRARQKKEAAEKQKKAARKNQAAEDRKKKKLEKYEANLKASIIRKGRRQKQIKAAMTGFAEGYKAPSHVCTQCGRAGKPATIIKGLFVIEIILWLCGILPGLIYSIWRMTTKIKGCPDCQTQTMVRADSPIGKKLLA